MAFSHLLRLEANIQERVADGVAQTFMQAANPDRRAVHAIYSAVHPNSDFGSGDETQRLRLVEARGRDMQAGAGSAVQTFEAI